MSKLSRFRTFSLTILFSILIASCGGGGDSSSGAGTDTADTTDASDTTSTDGTATAPSSTSPATAVVGPNLNGATWAGVLKSERDGPTNITATITHEGNQVTIVTTAKGVGHELVGTINASGKISMRDKFDGEDWTSVFGNVSTNSINLADFIANSQGRIIDQNIIILKR